MGLNMKYNIIGKSRLPLSVLGMGCWAYGGGKYWGDQSQSDVNDVVACAIENGITYFDTAEVYNDGDSETSLGIALKGKRSRAVIGSKVSTSNAHYSDLIAHCEASLKRLGTDYIDIYMLHWPINKRSVKHFSGDEDNLPTINEAFSAMQTLKEQGKIREIGLSNHGAAQMKEAAATSTDIAVNELPYNLISRAIELEIQPYCIDKGIGILGYMVYQQGILAGIYNTIDDIPESQAHSRHFKQYRGGTESRHFEDGAEAEITELIKYMRRTAAELNVSVPCLSLSWALANSAITSTLAGSRNRTELFENIGICDYRLPAEIKKELDNISLPILDALGGSADYYENHLNSRIY
jgi:aryl-alcohol dehydrogenase-like predicted oxidoreductase